MKKQLVKPPRAPTSGRARPAAPKPAPEPELPAFSQDGPGWRLLALLLLQLPEILRASKWWLVIVIPTMGAGAYKYLLPLLR
ncbi:MAG: hypothetical protein EPO01_20145 [Aquabacterium sp.]|nr:MAG: hypothetical protein EPO01_20145 [Aquabacterium sp.]